jgi:hypothetical protein
MMKSVHVFAQHIFFGRYAGNESVVNHGAELWSDACPLPHDCTAAVFVSKNTCGDFVTIGINQEDVCVF